MKTTCLFYSDEGLTSETSVSFLFLYGVEFTYLSLNCFFRNTDAAHTSLPLVIFSIVWHTSRNPESEKCIYIYLQDS